MTHRFRFVGALGTAGFLLAGCDDVSFSYVERPRREVHVIEQPATVYIERPAREVHVIERRPVREVHIVQPRPVREVHIVRPAEREVHIRRPGGVHVKIEDRDKAAQTPPRVRRDDD